MGRMRGKDFVKLSNAWNKSSLSVAHRSNIASVANPENLTKNECSDFNTEQTTLSSSSNKNNYECKQNDDSNNECEFFSAISDNAMLASLNHNNL